MYGNDILLSDGRSRNRRKQHQQMTPKIIPNPLKIDPRRLQNRAAKKTSSKTLKKHKNHRKWTPQMVPFGGQKAANEPGVATLLRPGTKNDTKTTPESRRDIPKPHFGFILEPKGYQKNPKIDP